jgi:hypothetical protein
VPTRATAQQTQARPLLQALTKKSNNYANFLKASTSLHLQRHPPEKERCHASLHPAVSFPYTCVSERDAGAMSMLREQPNCETLLHSHGGLNRDYRSVEWNQHFDLIEQEMDLCLQDVADERKQSRSSSEADEHEQLLNDQYDDVIELPALTLKPEPVSDSADSLDDLESSSSNTSELLTINLHPQASGGRWFGSYPSNGYHCQTTGNLFS